MRTLNQVFVATTLSLICVASYADVLGDYSCSVFDPKKNSHYTENLNISKTGATYRIQFFSPGTVIPYILGTGIMDSASNSISIVNWDAGSSTWVGAELFFAKPDGSLSGTWATTNQTLVGTEDCTKSTTSTTSTTG